MHRKGLSGIGVTEKEGGPLIGNLSMSDLRGLTPDRCVGVGLHGDGRVAVLCCRVWGDLFRSDLRGLMPDR